MRECRFQNRHGSRPHGHMYDVHVESGRIFLHGETIIIRCQSVGGGARA